MRLARAKGRKERAMEGYMTRFYRDTPLEQLISGRYFQKNCKKKATSLTRKIFALPIWGNLGREKQVRRIKVTAVNVHIHDNFKNKKNEST